MVFFYVPFSLLFCLLRWLEWTPQLIACCLCWWSGSRSLFAAVGFVEYATKTIFLNPKLVAANDVHTYFTVNSVFFDPDIFGRFLALVMMPGRGRCSDRARSARAGRRDRRSGDPLGRRSC